MENLKLIIKGGIFGIANIIPGVSGGTMAVVLGIYERMIEAIGNFITNKLKRKSYLLFLLKIIIGAGISIIVFSWIMDYLLNNYRIYTYLFFIGLIAGSIPAIYKTHPHMQFTIPAGITFICGAGLIMFLALAFPDVTKSGALPEVITLDLLKVFKLFIAGILSGGSMIVPGVSGSFILVLLGQYHYVIKSVKEFDVFPLIFLGAGIVLGIWAFAKLIDLLLKKYPKETMYFILGLVIASLYPIFPGLPRSVGEIGIALFIVVIAGGISYKLGDRR